MNIDLKEKKVRFSQIIPGKCFQTADGCIMMRIRQRDGDKSDAVNLIGGEVTRFVNTAAYVTPLNLKAVEDTE